MRNFFNFISFCLLFSFFLLLPAMGAVVFVVVAAHPENLFHIIYTNISFNIRVLYYRDVIHNIRLVNAIHKHTDTHFNRFIFHLTFQFKRVKLGKATSKATIQLTTKKKQ